MDSNTDTIYIPLLDEGTTVFRPTQGQRVGDDQYLVLATPNYDEADEHWQFPPGSKVRCTLEKRDGKNVLIARALV
jgi:hypothetical protein